MGGRDSYLLWELEKVPKGSRREICLHWGGEGWEQQIQPPAAQVAVPTPHFGSSWIYPCKVISLVRFDIHKLL